MIERNEKIAKLWETGLSSSKIARKLGVTKNVVIGVIHRLKTSGKVLHRKETKTAKTIVPTKRERKLGIKVKVKWVPILTEFDEPADENVTIEQLRFQSCRYIIGEVNGAKTIYCGKPKKGRSFCEQHLKLCYSHAKPVAVEPPDTAGNT